MSFFTAFKKALDENLDVKCGEEDAGEVDVWSIDYILVYRNYNGSTGWSCVEGDGGDEHPTGQEGDSQDEKTD